MEPLKIAVVDDNAEVVATLIDYLKAFPGALGDLKIQYIPYTDFENTPPSAQSILKDEPHVVITDYCLGPWGDNTGLKIANEIREENSYLPLFLITGIPLIPRNQVISAAMNKGIVDACFSKPFDFTKIQQTVRESIRRPLNVGITGLKGKMGLGFLEVLSEDPNIAKIKAHSESLNGDYSEIRDLEFVNEEKTSFVGRLEDVLEGTDCVLVCNSALYGKNSLAKNPDRSDLFPYECKKINDIARRIKQSGYQGLVVIFTNPVGQNLELSRRVGLNSGQLTSPLILDNERIYSLIRRQAIRDNVQAPEKGTYIVGEHGVPDVSVPPEASADYQKIVERVVEDVRTLPERSMRAHKANGISYHGAQRAYATFLRDLAQFKTRHDYSLYCYCRLGDKGGYIAVPSEVDFFSAAGIRVTPDQEKIEQLNEELKNKRFVEILAKQKRQADKYVK